MAAIQGLNPDVVVSGCPGCLLQLGFLLRGEGRAIPVKHTVQLLAETYAMEERGPAWPAASPVPDPRGSALRL